MNQSDLPLSSWPILIVDDDALSVEALSISLQDEGYNVETANSFITASEKIKSVRPAIVITDFLLPGGTGAELVAASKDQQNYIAICTSGFSKADILAQAPDAKFELVLTKPIDFTALQNYIKSCATNR